MTVDFGDFGLAHAGLKWLDIHRFFSFQKREIA